MTGTSQVHDQARDVLDFWFGQPEERWWSKDDEFDAAIARRFGALRERVVASAADGWRDDPDTLLAAIILIDQFSRNIYRDEAAAFAADDLAARLTLEGIDRGWEAHYPPTRRVFFYMPLMHAEDAPLQALSVAKFEALGIAENLDFARAHRDVIERFGRFPGRNVALGRESSAAEQAYLDEGGGW